MPLFDTNISQKAFFRQYWRRQPCVFKKACADSVSLLQQSTEISGLLELASQEIVESRMVEHPDYKLNLGPFQLEALPSMALLMIQGLEQYLDEINDLLLCDFSFLPRWRIEDVMVSAGFDGANCGPHFDQYDVFLIQVKGSKEWRLDFESHDDEELDDNASIRLLRNFEATTTQILDPGDVLYIPPGIGHWGICRGESTTLSVGIRNPTMQELVSNLADLIVDESASMETLDDLTPSPEGGLSDEVIKNLQSKLSEVMLDKKLIQHWYGSYVTEPREPDVIEINDPLSTESVRQQLLSSQTILCKRPTRLTYYDGEVFTTFVNGECFECNRATKSWLEPLCLYRTVMCKDIADTQSNIELLQALTNYGAIEFSKENTDD